MGKIELEALRKRALAVGLDPGTLARAARAQRASFGIGSRQSGLVEPPAPVILAPRALPMETVRRWVVAVCKPSMARGVGEDLNDLGFLAYCPLGRKVLIRARVSGSNARKRRVYEFPVFGPYLFVGESQEPLQASIHDGISGVLGDSLGPLSLNPRLVKVINDAELSGQWDEARVPDWKTHKFQKGDRITVRRGPFADLAGLVLECSKAGIKVEFDLFGRKTSTTLQPKALEVA